MTSRERLLQDIASNGEFDESRDDTVREAIRRQCEREQKRAVIGTSLICLLGLLAMYVGAVLIRDASEIRAMLTGLAILIIGYEITIVTKLGGAHATTLSRTLAAIKELQLEVLNGQNCPVSGVVPEPGERKPDHE
ncbi:MAG: hypothetical protein HN742_22005 [Lentisphaerae bacterium]|jgi:hypothetical protein|nr:hypothetical protein [Lentisphaerota bacterium]MBT5607334.1 hypothetical protein [Lentisphaerota bacterium]MBT7055348.1 hypothetical protein [Lentisphaerota bacterium]MBT7844568.1 hypothetical protein [Lentisphaerota bacterium]